MDLALAAGDYLRYLSHGVLLTAKECCNIPPHHYDMPFTTLSAALPTVHALHLYLELYIESAYTVLLFGFSLAPDRARSFLFIEWALMLKLRGVMSKVCNWTAGPELLA